MPLVDRGAHALDHLPPVLLRVGRRGVLAKAQPTEAHFAAQHPAVAVDLDENTRRLQLTSRNLKRSLRNVIMTSLFFGPRGSK